MDGHHRSLVERYRIRLTGPLQVWALVSVEAGALLMPGLAVPWMVSGVAIRGRKWSWSDEKAM
jgi:hypothetical protein